MPSALFSPIALRGLTLPNRLVVSPMCQYAAEDGAATDWHLMHLGSLALAEWLICIEATAVSPEGRITPGCLGLYSDRDEAALGRVLAFARRYGVAKFGIQLAHSGRKGSALTPLESGKPLPKDRAWMAQAPSALPYDADWPAPAALDMDGIAKLKRDFALATERAARLGIDLVELHMGHGYLMHQFLSPLSNRRNDRYGGDFAGRTRLPLETFDLVRAAWPEARPLGVRLSATDWVEGGWTPEETVALSVELKARGCDFVDVTTGGLDPRQKLAPAPGFQVPFAARVKREAGIAVMAVGLIAEPRQAETIVAEGQADMVALARGAMDDPRWPWHAARALGVETAYAPQMIRAHPKTWPPGRPAA
ncbi:MAG: NADH:flavin oxidoreductase/NADH oxidase [Alphaproteobacteria bacterium]|nr:NADH:flavin oxidoreductase/NADH oxidase [Alphaproteobacteria bacterium]